MSRRISEKTTKKCLAAFGEMSKATYFDPSAICVKHGVAPNAGSYLIKAGLIERVDWKKYKWVYQGSLKVAVDLYRDAMRKARGNRKPSGQGSTPLPEPKESRQAITDEFCINFLKKSTQYHYEIYRIERVQL